MLAPSEVQPFWQQRALMGEEDGESKGLSVNSLGPPDNQNTDFHRSLLVSTNLMRNVSNIAEDKCVQKNLKQPPNTT